ncbi:MAG: hypothetical protein KF760_14320 [Candidatus Eremiobacteraeota bacterium]|nr:hypothetical protein [Candidatus Eremiobacteraeota bacterium]MCW5868261.1 hypothetical protein [Candidatus Eremiobacteraeota bacterium]
MIRTNQQFCHLFGGGARAPIHTRHIPKEVTDSLRCHGLGRPIHSLDDPRLECPELLLLHGFEWGASEVGSCYQAQPQRDYYQTIVFQEDGGLRIISCTGDKIHDLSRSPEGEVTSQSYSHRGLPARNVLL